MRDWNYTTEAVEKLKSWLVAYLWGIETRKKSYISLLFVMLVAYLWGIETYQCIPIDGKCVHVSSLPMRDWNYLVLMTPYKHYI